MNLAKCKQYEKMAKNQPSCFCLCSFSFFWGGGEDYNSRILNDIGRNSLLGNRKKIAKFLMRTFTCGSTFLYAYNIFAKINPPF